MKLKNSIICIIISMIILMLAMPQVQAATSTNANLSSLGIRPNDFKGFKPATTSYDVTVPNNVDKVTVYATAQDKKAKIKGTGTKEIDVGKNALDVVVTAEDGKTTKTYTINVTRQDEKTASTNKSSANTTAASGKTDSTTSAGDNQNSDLKKISIKGYTLAPEFSPNVYEYKVEVGKDVTKLDIETEAKNSKVSIDMVGNENFIEGENTITLLVYNEETKQNSTYQITVNKTDVSKADAELTTNEAMKKGCQVRAILLVIIAIFIIGVIIFFIVQNKSKNNDDNEKYEYDEEDIERINRNNERLNLDDEEEFFDRVSNGKGKHF